MPELLHVMEHFVSIQGEGYNAGVPTMFVRFAGCNLSCEFCDTDWDFAHASLMSVNDLTDLIIRQQAITPFQYVIFTGGEPLLTLREPFVRENLLRVLLARGVRMGLETNGTIGDPVDIFQYFKHITVSPKLNSVGGCDIRVPRKYIDELRIPVVAGDQLAWIPEAFRDFDKMLFSPVFNNTGCLFNKDNYDHAFRMAQKYGGRVSLQTHKLINVQ